MLKNSKAKMNDKIISFLDKSYITKYVKELIYEWYKEGKIFDIRNITKTESGGIHCDVEGFAIPMDCFDFINHKEVDTILDDLQDKYVSICNNLSKLVGSKVSFEFYREEYTLRYSVRYYISAPCGCCKTLPHVYPEDFASMLSKFKKLSELNKEVRENIEHYNHMHEVDLFYPLYDFSDNAFSESQLEEFYKTSNQEILRMFKEYNNVD